VVEGACECPERLGEEKRKQKSKLPAKSLLQLVANVRKHGHLRILFDILTETDHLGFRRGDVSSARAMVEIEG
jgi:hypothetical protein